MKIIEKFTFDDVQIVPEYSDIDSRKQCNSKSQFTKHFFIDVPLIAAPMDSVCGMDMCLKLQSIGAVGCLHRFMPIEAQVNIIQELSRKISLDPVTFKANPIIATIGATGDYRERAERSLMAGANIILIDVAHGDHSHVKNAMNFLRRISSYPFDIIAGNIATADGAKRLEDWGADALRVGIGGGSMCETRVRTGVGVPQLSAVMDVVSVATVPVISDGGIKLPGDVAKALAAGADTVMLGSLFAGTMEAPGEMFETGQWPNVKKMKVFRGSACAAAKYAVKGAADYVEGTATMVSAKGSVETVVNTIMDGVRSSMSYVGVNNLIDFKQRAKFVRITNAGLIEAHPHGLR